MHPDHVGGARDIAELDRRAGASGPRGFRPVRSCVWGRAIGARAAGYWLAHGIPPETTENIVEDAGDLREAVHWRPDPVSLDAGDEVDGWRVEVLRGHADGHIVLVRDGVLIAGDTLLAGSRRRSASIRSPGPTRWATTSRRSRASRRWTPRIAYAGHRTPILDPAGRAREIRAHHEERLDRTRAALADGAADAVRGVACALRRAICRRSCAGSRLAEALAHLERLARRTGRAGRRRVRDGLIPLRHGAASHRRSRCAGKLPRARGDAAAARRGRRSRFASRPARRARRAGHPGRRVDDLHAPDASSTVSTRRCGQFAAPSSARAPG